MNKSVAKADLHGCLITVQKSKCPSYIGTEGIVLQETQNTFKLICKDDKLKSKYETNLASYPALSSPWKEAGYKARN